MSKLFCMLFYTKNEELRFGCESLELETMETSTSTSRYIPGCLSLKRLEKRYLYLAEQKLIRSKKIAMEIAEVLDWWNDYERQAQNLRQLFFDKKTRKKNDVVSKYVYLKSDEG